MAKSTFMLIYLMITASLEVALATDLSSPCTEEEMLKPIRDLHEIIEEMQTIHVDVNNNKEKLNVDWINDINQHMEKIRTSCGDEKTESLEKLKEFKNKIQMVEDIIIALNSGEMQKAIDMLENVHCKHVVQMLIWKYGTDVGKIKNLIEIVRMMDDLKMINIMNEGIIYVIDETKLTVLKDLIPLMKQNIEANKNNAETETTLTAKLNLKEIAKRTMPRSYRGLRALWEIDNEMAGRAIYEAASQMLTDSIHCPAWKIATEAPWIRLRAYALKGIFDKIWLLEIQNGLVAAKALILANNMIQNDEIKQCDICMKMLDDIISGSSTWAKNLGNGCSCQGLEEMRALVTGEDKREQHNKFIIFYNPEESEHLENKFVENPDGDLLMITVNRELEGKWMKYSILLANNDYLGSIHLKGNIISKKILGKEPVTREEICDMHPKPRENICISLKELFSWNVEDYIKNRNAMYENFLEQTKGCTSA